MTSSCAELPRRATWLDSFLHSAPKYAGKNVACPVAAILAGAMMLDYLGEKKASAAIENAVIELIRAKRIKGVNTGDHPTTEVGDMVVGELCKPAVAKV